MSAATAPVTVTAVRLVPAERTAAFERELRDFLLHAAAAPGSEGVQVLRRAGDERIEFTIVAGFADAEARRSFVTAPVYGDWMRRLSEFSTEPVRIEEQIGLRVWFTSPPGGGQPIPVWKTAVVTWVGVNLVTSALLPVAPHVLGGVPFPWSNFLFNLPVVALLAWLVMPALTHVLRGWLSPAVPAPDSLPPR